MRSPLHGRLPECSLLCARVRFFVCLLMLFVYARVCLCVCVCVCVCLLACALKTRAPACDAARSPRKSVCLCVLGRWTDERLRQTLRSLRPDRDDVASEPTIVALSEDVL